VASRWREVIQALYFALMTPHLDALHPALEPSAQERHGPVRVCPERGLENDSRAGISQLRSKAGRVGVVQPGEEKALGKPSCSLPVLQRGLEER